MAVEEALGLWRTSFGPVKIERDASGGENAVMGVWVYQRDGQEVVGYFEGTLAGNVLELRWQEPSTTQPLVGSGYLVFDPGGERFDGRWWTSRRDRSGDWSGWRAEQEGGWGAQGSSPEAPEGEAPLDPAADEAPTAAEPLPGPPGPPPPPPFR